jgi:hypothetical protein
VHCAFEENILSSKDIAICAVIGAICAAISNHNLVVGAICITTIIGWGLLAVIRERMLLKHYQAAYMLQYKSDKFDYEKEYEGFIMRFWCWNVKKYIDHKVDRTN